MTEKPFLAGITQVREIGSQRGETAGSFDYEMNEYLKLGWVILQTYIEGKGPESDREECVCLLGWPNKSEPAYPEFLRR